MKLIDYYASYFEEHGDLKIIKHPYYDLHVPSGKPCFFDKACNATNTFIAMSSRNKNKFENYHICLACSANYFTSWNQPDMIEYHQHAYGVDLNKEIVIPSLCGKYKYDRLVTKHDKKIKWLATQQNGEVVGFFKKPKIWDGYWLCETRFSAIYQSHIKAYDGDWKDSLQKIES